MLDRQNIMGSDKMLEAKAVLNNKELWNRFNEFQTEMIITKTGRRIFPILKVDFTDLEPEKYYCILLEMQQISPHRLKFTAESGWTSCGVEETPHPGVYVHPDSPSLGEHWMSQTVNFEKCKLTNSSAPSPGSLTLSSMHKYVPKIILVQTDNLQHVQWCPSKTFIFKETEFVAVTAYQNNSITALKIDHNPFAKGFRENGKSRCKKKLLEMEIRRRRSPLNRSPFSDSSPPSSSSPRSVDSYDHSSQDNDHSRCSHPVASVSQNSHPYLEQIGPVYPVPVTFRRDYAYDYKMGRLDYYHNQFYNIRPYSDQALQNTEEQRKKDNRENILVKKFTDFSIKNIIGEA